MNDITEGTDLSTWIYAGWKFCIPIKYKSHRFIWLTSLIYINYKITLLADSESFKVLKFIFRFRLDLIYRIKDCIKTVFPIYLFLTF